MYYFKFISLRYRSFFDIEMLQRLTEIYSPSIEVFQTYIQIFSCFGDRLTVYEAMKTLMPQITTLASVYIPPPRHCSKATKPRWNARKRTEETGSGSNMWVSRKLRRDVYEAHFSWRQMDH